VRNNLYINTSYYPYGMVMPNRHGNADYRYGFNGMEGDDEIKNLKGTSYDFGARMYDPRVARFFSRDPKESLYPWQSTYVFAINSPIRFIDLNGEGPGDRELNKEINKGLGNKESAGKNGDFLGVSFVFADVRESDGTAINKDYSNAYRIAKKAGVTLDELYEWNPGLCDNLTEIGQGQLIFTSDPSKMAENVKNAVNQLFKSIFDGTESSSDPSEKDNRSIFDDILEYLDDFGGGAAGSGEGFNSYDGDGKPGDIDDEVERNARFWGPHWWNYKETFRTDSKNGDTIFSEFDRYKWTWGDFENKRIKVTIVNGDTIKIDWDEELNHKPVKKGTIDSY
jgi:RHS repeat-associated protein